LPCDLNDIESLGASSEDLRPEIYGKTEAAPSKSDLKRNY
jgi:hypothetical protein